MPIPVTVVSEPSESALRIRRAVPDDAAAIVSVRGIGFRECGRLTRQVVIDGKEDDEVLMELFI